MCLIETRCVIALPFQSCIGYVGFNHPAARSDRRGLPLPRRRAFFVSNNFQHILTLQYRNDVRYDKHP
nr:MAG TPA_asm: hypothetical protein [Caudoviricetes sp.]